MKKGIIVASFGTSFEDVRKRCIESIEMDIKKAAGEIEVKRAFTSNMIIKKIRERDGIEIPTCDEAIAQMASEGVEEVFIQPLHIIPGFEYDKLKKAVSRANHKKTIKVSLGQPLLYTEANYDEVVEAITPKLPAVKEKHGVLLMGHGTKHHANAAYSMLQLKLNQKRNDIFIVNVEGFPEMEAVIDRLKAYEHMTMVPLMIVAGDHAMNDMAGEDEDSFKSILEAEGLKTNSVLEGLGENIEIRKIFSNRVKSWIEG